MVCPVTAEVHLWAAHLDEIDFDRSCTQLLRRGTGTLQQATPAANYLPSRINVGATPASVEKPEDVTAVSQLEQPCTLPR
jgi:hypothetical protein